MTDQIVRSFSGALAELPKDQRTDEDALRVLADHPRVSTFDRGTQWVESLLQSLIGQGAIAEDLTEQYPWHRFNLTGKGRAMLPANEKEKP